jgi:hypothetical protein
MNDTDKFLNTVNNDWGDNWDAIVDFFGPETAELFDKAILEMEERVKEKL